MSQTPSNNPEPDSDQIDALCEALGYLELESSRSREQFEELSKVVHDLSSRMQRLECRLVDLHSRLETPDPGLVPPPHSAGPDISRDPL